MCAPTYSTLEAAIVTTAFMGALTLIIYHYVKIDPLGQVRQVSDDVNRALHESVITMVMADYLYINMHSIRHDVLYWNILPDLLRKMSRYCIQHKLPLMSLRQFKYHLTMVCIHHNQRDAISVVEELFQHVYEILEESELDCNCRLNVIKICENILGLIRWGG